MSDLNAIIVVSFWCHSVWGNRVRSLCRAESGTWNLLDLPIESRSSFTWPSKLCRINSALAGKANEKTLAIWTVQISWLNRVWKLSGNILKFRRKKSNGDKLALGHAYHSQAADVCPTATMVKSSEQMQGFHQWLWHQWLCLLKDFLMMWNSE